MSKKIVSASMGDSVRGASKLMAKNNISGLLVSEGGRAVGVLTMRDVFKKVIAEDLDLDELKVGDVMSSPVLSVHPLVSVENAAKKMSDEGVRRLAVVDSGKIAGIVTVKDIVKALPDMMHVMFKTWVTPDWK